jgi:hypothetical protein
LTRGKKKVPLSVGVDGHPRPTDTVILNTAKAPTFRDFVLPRPISSAGSWPLGIEVVWDTTVTLATWALIAGIAALWSRGHGPEQVGSQV